MVLALLTSSKIGDKYGHHISNLRHKLFLSEGKSNKAIPQIPGV